MREARGNFSEASSFAIPHEIAFGEIKARLTDTNRARRISRDRTYLSGIRASIPRDLSSHVSLGRQTRSRRRQTYGFEQNSSAHERAEVNRHRRPDPLLDRPTITRFRDTRGRVGTPHREDQDSTIRSELRSYNFSNN